MLFMSKIPQPHKKSEIDATTTRVTLAAIEICLEFIQKRKLFPNNQTRPFLP